MPAKDADVIVIGAGAGGLTTAAYLASTGRHVIVADRRPAPGGNLTSFTRDGFEFDIGLHYLGCMGEAKPAIRAALEPLGIDLAFREQDPDGFDELLFEDGAFSVPRGVERFRRRLHDAFPDEREKVDRFLDRAIAVADQIEQPPPSSMRDAPGFLWRSRDLLASLPTTLAHEFDRLDCSPRLRTVLNWVNGIYGLPPSRTAFAQYAVGAMHYLRGAWYPEGGARAVSDALVEVIHRHGGEVLTDVEVRRIVVEHGSVTGVQLAPGPGGTAPPREELRAPAVVAAGDLKKTFLELIGPDVVPARLRHRVEAYEMAAPLFVVYLVLDRDLRAEGFANRNWSVVGCDDVEALYASWRHGQVPTQRWTWITSASLKDPDNPRLCGPGQTNLQLMAIAPASHAFWDVGPGLERGPAYAGRKKQLRDRLVADAERAIPGLAASIAFEDAATPVTLERLLGSTGGTSYGIAGTRRQIGMLRPGPRTLLPGLFLAGASTRAGHGVTGTMLGGMQTASAIAGLDVARELRGRAPRARAAPVSGATA